MDSPRRLTEDEERARVLEVVSQVSTPVWGRDELGTGEMWNSNSVIAWVVARSGLGVDAIQPPVPHRNRLGGRAPGWKAGVEVARRQGKERLFEQADDDTTRSAAGRAALETAVWAPASLVGDPDVDWRAEDDAVVVVAWAVPPERPVVRLRIDEHGAVKSATAKRWGNAQEKRFGYIPCGCEVLAERRFGDLVVPSRVTVGWWFGTPRYAPFFRAEISDVSPPA